MRPYHSSVILVPTAVLAVAVTACTDSRSPLGLGPADSTSTVATVAVEPAAVHLPVGASLTLSVALTDQRGAAMSKQGVTWSSSDTLVATVSPTGEVKAKGEGSARINASKHGNSAHADVTVESPDSTTSPADSASSPAPAPAPVASVTVTPGALTLDVGATGQLVAAVADSVGQPLTDRAVSWSSSSPAAATVSASGIVTALAAGVVTVTATSEGRSGSAAVTVRAPAPPPAAEMGLPIYPGESIQAKVNTAPAGTRFLIKAGVHRRQSVIPKSGMAFVGEPGAVLDGESAAEYAIWLGSSRPFPTNVVVRGLEIRNYASPLHFGAVRAGGHSPDDGSDGWVVDSCEIHHNRHAGVRIGHRMRVTNNRIHHNGMIGIIGAGDSTVVEGNEIAYNNPDRAIDPAWGAGGTKFVLTRWLVVRNNFVHHNIGAGLWTDVNNIYSLIEHNRSEDNTGSGIFHEISYQAVIRHNTVSRNGSEDSWMYGGGITVSASPDVEIYGNTVIDNRNGITGVQQVRNEPASYGAHELNNLYVHDNTVTMTSGATGIGQDVVNGQSYYTTRNNRFERNTYFVSTANRAPFHWMDGLRTETEWRAYGQDVTGTVTRR